MAATCGRLAAIVVLYSFSAAAAAQSLERAVDQVQVGFERAFRTPIEILMLRTAVRNEAWLALGPRAVARTQRPLHDHAVDPAPELEAHRAQRADAQETVGGVQPD